MDKTNYSGTANSTTMKNINAMAVARKILRIGNITRAELAVATNLTKSTVSTIVSDFLSNDLVIENEARKGAEGRPGIALNFNWKCGNMISLIFDYFSLCVVVTDLGAKILHREIVDYNGRTIEQTAVHVVDALFPIYNNCTYGVIGIMVGIIGTVDNQQRVTFSPLKELLDNTLKGTLENRFHTKVYLDKLGNLLASSQGIHAWQRDVCKIAVNIHSVVDMGAIINDELYRGFGGSACELGHTILVPNGKKCSCGNHGCAEQYVSNVAVLKRYSELKKETIDLKEFVVRVNSNEPEAHQVFEDFIFYTSILLNNIIALFSPRQILINSYIASECKEGEKLLQSHLKSTIIDITVASVKEYDIMNYVMGTANIVLRNFIYGLMFGDKNLAEIPTLPTQKP